MRKLIYFAFIVLLVQACKKSDTEDSTYSVDTTNESAQQVGDVSASVDEAGGNTNGSITTAALEIESAKKSFARLSGEELNTAKISSLFLPEAQAALCKDVAFGACVSTTTGRRVRDFASCTTGGGGVITGDVALTFSNSLCKIMSNGESVARVPNFTITGLRGATFTVNAPTTGQVVSRTGATNYNFTNNGIRRTFVTPKGVTLLDVTTTTGNASAVTPMTFTGDNRTNRQINGGTLHVVNNLTSDACTLTPTGIIWTGGCTCPTAGNWTGSCSPSGKTFKVTFKTVCGEATVENTGEATRDVVLDRCSS